MPLDRPTFFFSSLISGFSQVESNVSLNIEVLIPKITIICSAWLLFQTQSFLESALLNAHSFGSQFRFFTHLKGFI